MNEFDKWLKNKVDSEELNFEPKGWEQLKESLHPKENPGKGAAGISLAVLPLFNKYTGIAAAIIIALGTYFVLKQPGTNTIIKQKDTILAHNKLPNTKKQAATLTDDIEKVEHIGSDESVATVNKKKNNFANQKQTPLFDQTSTFTPSIATNKQVAVVANTSPIIITEPQEETILPATDPSAAIRTIQPNTINNKSNNELIDHYAKSDKQTNTIISNIGIGGGVNYGSLNTGYAVALSAQKDLSNNLFVEGSIGMSINNNSSQTIVGLNDNTNFLARPAPGRTFINAPAITNTTPQLLYVQFNPSIGYNFENKLAFSVGSDLQQMINNRDDKFIAYNAKTNQSEIMPTLDLGITTKTELSLNKNIKTGLILRNGLNNIFQGQNEVKYVNRRYFQVQFRYLFNFKKKSNFSRF